MSDFVKQFAVCVLCCFLLCNSIFAFVDPPVYDSDSSDSDSVDVISYVETPALPDTVDSVVDSDSAEVITDVETPALPETVDSVVDSVSDLVDTATSEFAPGESISEVSPGGNTVYVLTQPDSEVVRDVTPPPVSIDDPGVIITDISLSSVAPVTPSSTSGLKAALLGILGNYDPVIVEYQYQSGQGYNNYLREVQPDYVWLCSAALLALVIYCLFKLGGGLIRG